MRPTFNLRRNIIGFGLTALMLVINQTSVNADQLSSKNTAECLADKTCQKTVLKRVETRMGTLEYKAGYPTKSTIENLYNEMDY